MSKTTKPITTHQLVTMFVLFFVVNFCITYFANKMFPDNIVLGTHFHSLLAALIFSNTALTIVVTGAISSFNHLSESINAKFTDGHWFTAYYLANFVGIWIVARFAYWLGMGISSWAVAAILGVVFALAQFGLTLTTIRKIPEK